MLHSIPLNASENSTLLKTNRAMLAAFDSNKSITSGKIKIILSPF